MAGLTQVDLESHNALKNELEKLNKSVMDEYSSDMFLRACKRFELTSNETREAFWRAYADAFVPSTGIEFRHIYKHVLEIRKESGEGKTLKLYSYEEAIRYCEKTYGHSKLTDHFIITDTVNETTGKKQWRLING